MLGLSYLLVHGPRKRSKFFLALCAVGVILRFLILIELTPSESFLGLNFETLK